MYGTINAEKEKDLMQVIHGRRIAFLLESEGDVQKAIDKLIKCGEIVAVFFHASNGRSIIGRVMVSDCVGIELMKGRISSRLCHENDPLCVRAGECMT